MGQADNNFETLVCIYCARRQDSGKDSLLLPLEMLKKSHCALYTTIFKAYIYSEMRLKKVLCDF